MKDFLELFNFEFAPASFSEFLIGLITTIVFSILIRSIYKKFSSSVSNKTIIADLFPLFAVAIFLIIITIKTSIVLSLGLVGALSIIRFRTAIKEPEQIIFFLLITAISISTASGAFLFPLMIIIFVWSYYYFNSKTIKEKVYSFNDQLIISGEKIQISTIKQLVKLLNNSNVNVEIQSINKQEDNSTIVLKVSDFEIDLLQIVENFLKENNLTQIDIQFFSSSE
jgi:hypothetical protein